MRASAGEHESGDDTPRPASRAPRPATGTAKADPATDAVTIGGAPVPSVADRPAASRLSVATAQRLQSAAGNRAMSALMAQRRSTATRPSRPAGQHAGGQKAGGAKAGGPTVGGASAPAAASKSVGPDVAAYPVQRAEPGSGTPVQRLATAESAGTRAPADSDPKFAGIRADVHAKQQVMAAHPPAAAEAGKAQAAAKAPPDDKQAQGKAANAEKMNAAKPGEFDKAAFIAAVNQAIAAQAPKNLDEADNFAESGKADAVKGQVQGQVGAGKRASAGQIESTTKAPPDLSAAKDKPVTPLAAERPPGPPGTPDPSRAVPDKAPASATDFSAGPAQVDAQMADAQVTEEQLAHSNEPEFTGALKDKKAGEAHAATAPGQLRAGEAQTLGAAKAQAGQAGAATMNALAAERGRSAQAVGAGKQDAKGSDEAKRAQVTAKLQVVFDATKSDVEAILSGLDKRVDEAFTGGEKAARDAFTAEHKRRMDAYKDERYSGLLGKARWLKDKFAGLPAEANQIFVAARQGYVARMQQVISGVADVIGVELGRAKQRIAAGRTELQAEVKRLPADLQAVGKQAAGEFTGRFDELTESVDAKGKELVQTLASKYNEALKSVDAEIDAEKEKNKGLIAKAVDAVGGVIKTILELKDLLLGVLAKAATAVMAIIKDPIGFLGHLVSAVGAGLQAFLANIGEHLKKGLLGWLLGAMASAGLQLPAKFDLRGILTMVGSLLGLTWGAIRARVVAKGVPEQAMGAVEQSVPVAQKLQSEGVAGVTEEIKEQVGDLKGDLLGKISEFLIPTVLVAGITWIVSLLNPASAFIKACKMIIDIVTFIVERGAQIVQFVNAVLDAVIAIAGGGAGGVPGLIEKALAASIPVLIGALAAILGIGGIADEVKKFFAALSRPVMKAVDWIVGKIVALGKKIWAKLKGTFGRAKKEDPRREGGKDQDKLKRPEVAVGFDMAGESHHLKFNPAPDGGVEILMASNELPLTKKFRMAHVSIDNFKHYMATVTDPEVRRRYAAELEPKLAKFPADQVAKFKSLYESSFPKGAGALGKDQEKLAAARVSTLVKAAEGMLAEIREFGAITGIPDLAEDKINATLQNKANELWRQSHQLIKERIATVVAGFDYKGQPIGFVGSVASGWRGPPKGTTHFDAADFDVDLYVVHAQEYDAVARRRPELVTFGKIFPGPYTPELALKSREVAAALKAEFPQVARVGKSDIVLRRVKP